MPEVKVRCECDYDCEGDPLRYVKRSHYCPEHDECEGCGERLGVMKDPAFPDGYTRLNGGQFRVLWICQECRG